MNEETLLGLLTGGKFGTSADLPTIPEAAHSYIDQVTAAFEESRQEPQQVVGEGLGLLDMVGGFSKAGALIPAMTKQYSKSASGQSKVADIINKIQEGRSQGQELLSINKALRGGGGLKRPDGRGYRLTAKKLKENINPSLMRSDEISNLNVDGIFNEISKQRKLMQVYEKALEQYNKFGAARPGTEDFIQTLLKQLKVGSGK